MGNKQESVPRDAMMNNVRNKIRRQVIYGSKSQQPQKTLDRSFYAEIAANEDKKDDTYVDGWHKRFEYDTAVTAGVGQAVEYVHYEMIKHDNEHRYQAKQLKDTVPFCLDHLCSGFSPLSLL